MRVLARKLTVIAKPASTRATSATQSKVIRSRRDTRSIPLGCSRSLVPYGSTATHLHPPTSAEGSRYALQGCLNLNQTTRAPRPKGSGRRVYALSRELRGAPEGSGTPLVLAKGRDRRVGQPTFRRPRLCRHTCAHRFSAPVRVHAGAELRAARRARRGRRASPSSHRRRLQIRPDGRQPHP